jgi:hypothetical protein
MSVTRAQRFHSKRNPCPICAGGDDLRRGHGKRCSGFHSSDGTYAHCSREEYAGSLLIEPNSRTFGHRLIGPCRCGQTHGDQRDMIRRAVREPKLTPPPADEVAALWASCSSVVLDKQVSDWLRSRNLDPDEVADRDLARALTMTGRLPGWAGAPGFDWAQSRHRCIVPMYDAQGALASLRARCIITAGVRKELAPTGFAAAGLVMADTCARQMLEGGESFGPLWIAEGVPDFLTAACAFSDSACAAVIGVTNGGWTEAIAARVPNGARAVIATHDDADGERYAARIGATLARRARPERFRSFQTEAS